MVKRGAVVWGLIGFLIVLGGIVILFKDKLLQKDDRSMVEILRQYV